MGSNKTNKIPIPNPIQQTPNVFFNIFNLITSLSFFILYFVTFLFVPFMLTIYFFKFIILLVAKLIQILEIASATKRSESEVRFGAIYILKLFVKIATTRFLIFLLISYNKKCKIKNRSKKYEKK